MILWKACGECDMTELQTVIPLHKYSITKLPDGRYNTYVRTSKRRKNIKASTYDALIHKLYIFYTGGSFFENQTLDELFHEWINYRKTITESPNTINRHIQRYNKYLKDSYIFKKQAPIITPMELNSFCNELVRTHEMSSKEWINTKTILKGIFDFALENDYISKSPLDRVRITVRFRQVNRKNGRTETFNTDERKDLIKYLDSMWQETKDPAFIAVKLNLYLGLRVGELVALKWEDIGDTYVHVYKEEIRDQLKGEYFVVNHTKTNQNRYVALIGPAKSCLDALACTDDYIFIRDGQRLTSRQINYVLEKYAERTGTVKKSSHKLRKTYASMLQANGVPIDEISKQLGHSNLETTMAYLFNPLTEAETIKKIEQALI